MTSPARNKVGLHSFQEMSMDQAPERKTWIMFGEADALPCPKCGSSDLEFNANVVTCYDCDHWGPDQDGPEILCDWRDAINDWNIAAGGEDFFGRSKEKLKELGLLPNPSA